MTEGSGAGAGFLPEVCLAWEAEAERAAGGGSVGVVAVATVSGLPQAEDHALVVAALRDILSNLAG